jgi:acetylornithine deacetylase/succinyl-diaminopimelate desuccinylase-like protein
MSIENVDSYLVRARARHLASLFELLSIPSVSSKEECADSIEACAAWLGDHLREIGAENVVLLRAGGNPVVYGDWLHAPAGAPTVLVYGHYDVQPPEPLDLWESAPFEPSIRDGRIFARGVSDNKGQFYLYLKAFEAMLETEGGLPVNVKFLLEGEEELRADHLAQLVTEQASLLRSDFAAVCDSGFFDPDVPGVSTGLRGMAALNFTLRTANGDLHSGGFGGTVPNALHAMATLVHGLHSPEDGHVCVEGFYDKVLPVSEDIRKAWAALPFDASSFQEGIGVTELFGERGFSPLERLWARPTLEICGLWGGYEGPGVKTIVPCEAHAKISCRLVPDQDPNDVLALVRRQLEKNLPPGVSISYDYELPGCYPVVTSTEHPALLSALAALKEVYGKEPVIFRNGGSVPVVEIIRRLLGLDSVLLGFAGPDENFHAPNEFLRLDNFDRGPRTVVRFWLDVAQRWGEDAR